MAMLHPNLSAAVADTAHPLEAAFNPPLIERTP
jgi:hypothetical protein